MAFNVLAKNKTIKVAKSTKVVIAIVPNNLIPVSWKKSNEAKTKAANGKE